MGKTNTLRKLVYSLLSHVCQNVYYSQADEKNMYPHIVFAIASIDLGDLNRDDAVVDIDIWDKGTSAVKIEDMADEVEAVFRNNNLPQENILPTFFLMDRKSVPDEDKKILHRLIRVQVQNYERRA